MLASQRKTVPAALEPDPIDTHVGTRLRHRRTLVGMSQQQLGKYLGVTFQQIQKYERAANRISASRLFRLARILDIPVGWFYEEMPTDLLIGQDNARLKPDHDTEEDILDRRETLELVRAYYKLRKDHRRRFYGLLKLTAEGDAKAS